jgi:hypothetical protein
MGHLDDCWTMPHKFTEVTVELTTTPDHNEAGQRPRLDGAEWLPLANSCSIAGARAETSTDTGVCLRTAKIRFFANRRVYEADDRQDLGRGI